MRILMTVTRASLLDGINRHILNVVPELNRQPGIECAVCIVQPEGEFAQALKSKGVKVYSLGAPHGHHWKTFVGFYRAVRDYRPDFMHDAVTCLAERVVAKLFFPRLKWVSTFHGVRCAADVRPPRNPFKRLMCRMLRLDFQKVFYVSPNCMEQDAAFGLYTPERRRVGVNPFDFNRAKAPCGKLRKLIGVAADAPLVGTACRIDRIKRPDLFTEVMCRVLRGNPAAHAVIIGDGPALPQVRDQAAASGVADRFHLLGYRPDVEELDGDLDCFVMTSEREGLPTSLLEAVAADVPVAFMKVPGGLTDIARMSEAQGDFAVVTEFGEVEKLADGILRLLSDGAAGKGRARAAKEACAAEYDMRRAVEQFVAGYREFLEER